jgi:glucosyl-3-phosphoglycerate phosphatase
VTGREPRRVPLGRIDAVGVRELLLVRHGESEGNVAAAEAHSSGAEEIAVPARDADVGLSDLGRAQA